MTENSEIKSIFKLKSVDLKGMKQKVKHICIF